MSADRNKAARELLAFYREAGVDSLVGEAPVDRLADVPAIAPPVPSAARVAERPPAPPDPRIGERSGPAKALSRLQTAPLPPSALPLGGGTMMGGDAAVMAAREAARSAASLEELRAILSRFEGCALRNTATQLVFADGTPGARVMFVGEAPGRDEDIEGLPFVGRSGKLLDRMMAAVGLDRTSVYIANIVPWRPPGNRDPSPQESAICLPFIRRQIELCNPDILVCLGRPSMQTLLATTEPITKARGRWFTFHTGTREIRAMPTLHPAYLLRQPLAKRLVWRDFLTIKKALSA
jgi:DNA polymerase